MADRLRPLHVLHEAVLAAVAHLIDAEEWQQRHHRWIACELASEGAGTGSGGCSRTLRLVHSPPLHDPPQPHFEASLLLRGVPMLQSLAVHARLTIRSGSGSSDGEQTIALPLVVVPDVRSPPQLTTASGPATAAAATATGAGINPTEAALRAILVQSRFFAHLQAALARAREATIEERLLREFIQRADSNASGDGNRLVSTPTSALVRLVHLMLAYEGFLGAPNSSTPPSAASSSQQSIFTLIYQHRSLVRSLPHHRVTIKLVRLGSGWSATRLMLHAKLESNVDEASLEIAPKIFSMQLSATEYLHVDTLPATSDGVAPTPVSATVQYSYRRLGSLLRQCRNRVLKHLLGTTDYREDSKERHASSASAQLPPTILSRLPQEIALTILQHLDSRDLASCGCASWSLQYLSAHSLLWQTLCERELEVDADSSSAASAAQRSDWKSHFLAQRDAIRRQQARASADAVTAVQLDQRMRHQLWPRPPDLWPPPPPGAFHPTPFGVHPDAPFFTLPHMR